MASAGYCDAMAAKMNGLANRARSVLNPELRRSANVLWDGRSGNEMRDQEGTHHQDAWRLASLLDSAAGQFRAGAAEIRAREAAAARGRAAAGRR